MGYSPCALQSNIAAMTERESQNLEWPIATNNLVTLHYKTHTIWRIPWAASFSLWENEATHENQPKSYTETI